MKDSNKIPAKNNQDKKEKAINKKGIPSDGTEINHQVEDKREQHQPRDNA